MSNPIYVHLKDKTNSLSTTTDDGVCYNNATVTLYEHELPQDVRQKITLGILEITTKENYDKWVKSQEEAAENYKRKKAILKGYAGKKADESLERAGKPKAEEKSETVKPPKKDKVVETKAEGNEPNDNAPKTDNAPKK